MDVILKQRIVGSIVLLSIAIIILPAILTTDGELFANRLKSNIPPAPIYKIQFPQEAEAATGDENVASANLAQVTTGEKDNPILPEQVVTQLEIKDNRVSIASLPISTMIKESSNTVAIQQSKPTANPNGITQKPSAKKVVIEAAKSEVVKLAKLEPKVSDTPKNVTGWVVQVASFSKKSNATALQNRLREQGHASFVETLNGKNGMIYRVRVGPEMKQSLAKNLKKKILQQVKLDGIVMRYP